ncbi:MAG: energy transducer TonB [Gammaproteobacteria bacterium HGW-Gammaproteobacteria-15]|nr:MAG: energy transducer TonB [Gammaproteobacteria bacterium HGW-Gammaproteobacteria-15]
MKLPTILAIALATAVFQADANIYADVQLSLLQPAAADAIWSRETQVTPRYPIELAQQGIAGCGVFNVTINENGKTTDVSLVNSVPGKVIARPAIKVIKKWQWVNNSSVANAAEQKLIRLDFCIGGSTTEEAEARCKVQAALPCQA